MGAYLSLDKKLDRINSNVENHVSEIVAITTFADRMCKELRDEIQQKDKLIEEYKDTIERQTAIISRMRSQQKKQR